MTGTTKATLAQAEDYVKNHDWSASDALTDADIARQIAADPDVAPDMSEHRRGRNRIDMAALRRRLGMTQAEFARAYRFSIGAVRDIEQGRRVPSGSAVSLLRLIDKDPEFVKRTLAG